MSGGTIAQIITTIVRIWDVICKQLSIILPSTMSTIDKSVLNRDMIRPLGTDSYQPIGAVLIGSRYEPNRKHTGQASALRDPLE